MPEPSPLRVVYRLIGRGDEDGFERIRAIALEQTVEIPAEALTRELERRAVGRLESIERIDKRLWRAVVDYPAAVAGLGDLPQLLNWLFGNIALYDGVVVESVEWSDETIARFQGPRRGTRGLRALFPDAGHRPLTMAAIKSLGETAGELGTRAGALARAGFDLVKDDHGLADQESAPYADRLAACAEAVARANQAAGGRTRYVPNLTGPIDGLEARLDLAKSHGVEIVMLSPWLMGLDVMRRFSREAGVAIVAHPTLAGALAHPHHGLSPGLVLGDLMRLAGADAVIFPWAGGRFRLSAEEGHQIIDRLSAPIGELLPAMPVVGGGLPIDREPPRLPLDTILLFGGFLYVAPDLQAAGRAVVERVARLWPS